MSKLKANTIWSLNSSFEKTFFSLVAAKYIQVFPISSIFIDGEPNAFNKSSFDDIPISCGLFNNISSIWYPCGFIPGAQLNKKSDKITNIYDNLLFPKII